jgi:hypothetical protein
MSISSIPSTFLPGFRNLLTSDTLQLLWNNRSSTEKAQITKEAAVGAPPANFLPNPNVTSLAREAAWFALTDAQRATYADGTVGGAPAGSLTNGNSTTTYQQTGFGSQTATTPSTTTPVDFTTTRLGTTSQTPSSDILTAYRTIWKDDFATTNVLRENGTGGETNGGAIFVSIRAGAGAERVTNPYIDDTTRSNDSYDLFETFVTSLAKSITDRFGSSQALLGYDTNDNGFIDSENELFGFDGTTAGPSLNTAGLVSGRLMVLTSAGASVRVDQSIFGTTRDASSGFMPYTTAFTTLQQDAAGALELVVETRAGIATDPSAPQIAWIGLPNAALVGGDDLDVAVTFNRDVTFTGTDSTLALDIGGTTRQATFLSSSGSTAIFRYTVDPQDVDANGVTVPADPLTLNTSTIRDANGNDADLTIATFTNARTLVGTQIPSITTVDVPAGNYAAGDTLSVTLTFDKGVTIDTGGGSPTLALAIGSNTRAATLASTTATSATFDWVIQSNDLDNVGGVTIGAGAISLNGSTFRDVLLNDADLSNTTVATSSADVDGIAPALSATAIASGNYNAGASIQVDLTFDEAVVVTGTDSSVDIDVGGVTRQAVFQSAAGNVVTFAYTVQPGETDTTGVQFAGNAVNLGTSTFADAFGNPVTTINPGTTNFPGALVDTTAPSATTFSSVPANVSVFTTGDPVSVTLDFDEALTLTGSDVTLEFLVNGNARTATVTTAPGSGLTSLTFTYVTGSQGADLGTGFQVTQDSLLVGGGSTLTDAAGNTVNLLNPFVNRPGIDFV